MTTLAGAALCPQEHAELARLTIAAAQLRDLAGRREDIAEARRAPVSAGSQAAGIEADIYGRCADELTTILSVPADARKHRDHLRAAAWHLSAAIAAEGAEAVQDADKVTLDPPRARDWRPGLPGVPSAGG